MRLLIYVLSLGLLFCGVKINMHSYDPVVLSYGGRNKKPFKILQNDDEYGRRSLFFRSFFSLY